VGVPLLGRVQSFSSSKQPVIAAANVAGSSAATRHVCRRAGLTFGADAGITVGVPVINHFFALFFAP